MNKSFARPPPLLRRPPQLLQSIDRNVQPTCPTDLQPQVSAPLPGRAVAQVPVTRDALSYTASAAAVLSSRPQLENVVKFRAHVMLFELVQGCKFIFKHRRDRWKEFSPSPAPPPHKQAAK